MKMLYIGLQKLIIVVLVCFFSTIVSAQEEINTAVKTHKFTLYAGLGPNYYFNNLVPAKEYVKELNYSFAARFMWEPEHLLSLGIESGYNKLYTVDFKEQSDARISNAAIPILIVVSMKFLKTFYFNFGTGQSILLNKVSDSKIGDINSSVLSLGDFAGAFGYRKQVKEHLSLGAESKFYYSSKLNDKNIALLFMVGYSF
jgi:hypothetical protein